MDPFLIQAGVSALSSLFGKSQKKPQYQAPQMPDFASMYRPNIPDYSTMLQQAGSVYDPAQGPVYQSMLGQYQTGRLPPEYRQAVLAQAQQEAGAAFDQSSQRLNRERGQATSSAAAEMNKLGILSSGALGVRQGMIDQSYGEQYGNLAQNYQSALGKASLGLMDQELSQRDRIGQLLAGIDSQRANTSLSSRNALLSSMGQDRALQAQMAGQQAQLGTQAYQLQQNNAANQYAADQYAYQQNGAAMGNLWNTAMSAAGHYGRQRTLRTSRGG